MRHDGCCAARAAQAEPVGIYRQIRPSGGGARFILRKWTNSSGHRENMLTPEWKTIGVGVTRNIWVIDFTK